MNIIKELSILSNEKKFDKQKLLELINTAKNKNIKFDINSYFIPKLFLSSDISKKELVQFVLNSDYFQHSFDNKILSYIIDEENNPLRLFIFKELIKKDKINPFIDKYLMNLALKKYY